MADKVEARKERKRALDRQAQRQARERTRNRMAELERTIEQLKSQKPDDRVNELLKEVQQLRAEREPLLKIGEQMSTLAESLKAITSGAQVSLLPTLQTAPHPVLPSFVRSLHANPSWTLSKCCQPSTTPFLLGVPHGAGDPRTPELVTYNNSTPIDDTALEECLPKALTIGPTSSLMECLWKGYIAAKEDTFLSTYILDTHTLVKGILNGWESFTFAEQNSLWSILRHLCKYAVKEDSGKHVDRLAMCYHIQLAMLQSLDRETGKHSDEIPYWLNATALQIGTNNQTNLGINLIPWPEVRDWLIEAKLHQALFADSQSCEEFLVSFLSNLRFKHRIGMEYAYDVAMDSGRLELSKLFKHLFFTDCPFVVAEPFLEKYPALRGYAPLEEATVASTGSDIVTSRVSSIPGQSPKTVSASNQATGAELDDRIGRISDVPDVELSSDDKVQFDLPLFEDFVHLPEGLEDLMMGQPSFPFLNTAQHATDSPA